MHLQPTMAASAPRHQPLLHASAGRPARPGVASAARAAGVLAALWLTAAACGSGPGGLGIGFGPDTAATGAAIAATLHIERVYLPVSGGSAAYVEIGNDGPEALDWTLSPAKLVSTHGEAAMPTAGTLAAGDRVLLTAAEVAPLLLDPDVGELLLMRGDLSPLGYVAWGIDPNSPRSGLANIAERTGRASGDAEGVPVLFAYGLPSPRSNAQALLFGHDAPAGAWCADANSGVVAPARTACVPGP